MIILGFLVILLFLSIVYVVAIFLGLWKIFEKINEEGWKSLVPYYNISILCKATGVSLYWIYIIMGAVIMLLNSKLIIISLIILAYFSYVLYSSLANSFGKDKSFTIGLFLLPPLFLIFLAYGDSTYIGRRPYKDPVMKFIEEKILHKEHTEYPTDDKPKRYCTNCGALIEHGDLFCTSCGKKI